MSATVPRELMERALANAERSRDFEELYVYDLREQVATHQKRLDGLRNDVARMKAWLDEEETA